jgi:hypothetical protein
MRSWVLVGLTVIVGVAVGLALGDVDTTQREYMLALAVPDTHTVIVGVVVVGLNKHQAEGAAVQLNETFRQRSIPLTVTARPQLDIGNYHPKPK